MNFQKLTDYINNIDLDVIPGCDCAVFYGHEPVFRYMRGYSDADKTKPVSERDVYWMYSCTKIMTVTAAMHLVETGKLKLSDPVSRYLPAYKNLTVQTADGVAPAKNVMTVRDLFSMTAGLDYDLDRPELKSARENTENPATTQEIASLIARKPLLYEPSTFYGYSLAHDVLAAVCEVASGMQWGEYLKSYMFEPLGMTDTGFIMTDEKRERLSTQYWYNYDTGKAQIAHQDNYYAITSKHESGGAGIISTVNDYGKLADALCNDGVSRGGYRLLTHASIEELKTCRLSPAALDEFTNRQKAGYGYALGVRTLLDPEKASARSPRGEFGWDSAGGAYMMIDTKNRIGVFYCQHVLGCGPAYERVHPDIRDIVYECLEL